MNILISHSWLKEFVKTDASPKEIADLLSLHSASVDSVQKIGDDYVCDIEITTNRVDMMSIAGIAREAAAVLKANGKKAELVKKLDNKILFEWRQKNNYLSVKIDKSLCSRFSMLLFEAEVKPSPKWLQERLQKAGIRAINNIVDITNYVMMETGQPMHAFDFEKIAGAKMILRQSKSGESLTTLDGVKRNLRGGDIVIEDNKKLIDLCGIMGGENSAVDSKTKKVLIFAQTYDPLKIRKTTQTTGLRSEASSRFEKGIDSELVIPALRLAEELLLKTNQAKMIGGLLDIYQNPYKGKKVSVKTSLIQTYLGLKISSSEITGILKPLGFKTKIESEKITADVPSWRANDINIAPDLIEEIARIYGYHNLPAKVEVGTPIQAGGDQNLPWIEKAKDALKYWGFNEIYTSSLTAKEDLEKFGFNPQKTIKLKNPLTSEGEYLRPSIIPAVVKAVEENKPRTDQTIKIFELSKVYLPKRESGLNHLPRPALPAGRRQAGFIKSPVNEALMLTGAVSENSDQVFLKVKGVVEELLKELGVDNYAFDPKIDNSCPIAKLLHPAKRLALEIKQSNNETTRLPAGQVKQCGLIGQYNNLMLFDLDFEMILKYASSKKSYQPIPQYPPVIEDITFALPEKTYVGEMMEEIRKSSALIVDVQLITSYKNTRTFRLYFQHKNKNLTEKEAALVKKKLIGEVGKRFGGKIKSK